MMKDGRLNNNTKLSANTSRNNNTRLPINTIRNLNTRIPGFSRPKKQKHFTRQNSRLAWESRLTAQNAKLDLIIECRRLPRKDSFSQADAFCCLWEVSAGYKESGKKISRLPNRQEREIGRTEVVRENKSPKFTTTFRLEHKFHEEQTYVIRVYDEDLRYATDLKEHDFVGGCVFTLGELMGAGGCTIARPLQNGKAFIILTGQEIVETREVLEFRFSGQDLGLLERKNSKAQLAKDVLEQMEKLNVAKTVLDKFDPYFRLEKLNKEDQSWKVVWKSEVVKDSQNPTWTAARIPLQLLCDDDPTSPLKITIWVWNRFAPDELVGFVETTVNELVQKAKRGIPVFDVMFEKKKILGGTKLKKTGKLKVLKGVVRDIPSMLQYLSGGASLNLIIGVDCSLSNGDWHDENSLHYHSSTWLNDYQAAIYKIGNIFDAYENKAEYTMWGYAARLRGVNQPYFSIGEDLHVADDLIRAYDRLFSVENDCLKLGESADMKHIIQAGMYEAIRASKVKQCYTTLVILTSGMFTDVQESIDAVCAAAEDAPLSIVIIGIGNEDFTDIQQLAGGEYGKLRHSNGVPVARHMVHFVAMSDFHGNARECIGEALREVPEQFVQHFVNNGIRPNPPKAIPDFSGNQVYAKAKESKKSQRSMQ